MTVVTVTTGTLSVVKGFLGTMLDERCLEPSTAVAFIVSENTA